MRSNSIQIMEERLVSRRARALSQDQPNASIKAKHREEKITLHELDQMDRWLESYPNWKMRISTIKSQLAHVPVLSQRLEWVASHGQGSKNDSVLQEVIRRLQLREEELPFWELFVQVIEEGLAMLSPEDRQFLDLKYNHRLSNEQLMKRFHISAGMLFRKRQHLLREIYEAVGGSGSVLWISLKSG